MAAVLTFAYVHRLNNDAVSVLMSLSTTASVLTTPLAHLLVSSLHTVCCSVVTVGCVECCIIVRWLRMVMSEVVDTNDDLYY